VDDDAADDESDADDLLAARDLQEHDDPDHRSLG
jgi:hypothetical protein